MLNPHFHDQVPNCSWLNYVMLNYVKSKLSMFKSPFSMVKSRCFDHSPEVLPGRKCFRWRCGAVTWTAGGVDGRGKLWCVALVNVPRPSKYPEKLLQVLIISDCMSDYLSDYIRYISEYVYYIYTHVYLFIIIIIRWRYYNWIGSFSTSIAIGFSAISHQLWDACNQQVSFEGFRSIPKLWFSENRGPIKWVVHHIFPYSNYHLL
jgi:hypothetical protein